MSQVLNMFSPESDEFELTGIKTLSKALRYHPVHESRFLSGLLLSEDLQSDQDVILYTSGTPLTYKRVARLLHLHENNPSWDLQFKIRRSTELIDSFRKDIVAKLKKLTEFRKNFKVYSTLLGSIEKELNSRIDEVLSDENITLELYKMKYVSDSSECKGSSQFFNHSASVAVFAFAIAKSGILARKTNFTDEEYRNLLKAAFFHNIGAVLEVDLILRSRQDLREKHYRSANRKSVAIVEKVKLSSDVLKAIKYVTDYYFGSKGVAAHEDNNSIWMANIIIVADKYLLLESGLFGDRVKPSLIVDGLNVQVVNEELNRSVVNALTHGLGFKVLSDFYAEIEKIRSMCQFMGGGSAWPYPVKGFRSPTLFVCRSDHYDCEYYERSIKAVSLVQKMGLLKEGKYARCRLATPVLQQYYRENKAKMKGH